MAPANAHIVALDLGQSADFTALSIVQRVMVATEPTARSVAHYHVVHLHRYPLGTRYTAIVTLVKELLATPPLGAGTRLVIDKTGVGAAVVDLFTGDGLTPFGITITGGDAVTREGRQYRVPKRDLVSVLIMLFQGGRLRIAAGLPEAATLVNELTNFRMKINIATGHDTYESWRESVHDDLVLSVAMACWLGEHLPRPGSGTVVSAPSVALAALASPVFPGDRPPDRRDALPDWTLREDNAPRRR